MGTGGRSLYPGMYTKGIHSPLFPPIRTPTPAHTSHTRLALRRLAVINLKKRPGARCPSPRGAVRRLPRCRESWPLARRIVLVPFVESKSFYDPETGRFAGAPWQERRVSALVSSSAYSASRRFTLVVHRLSPAPHRLLVAGGRPNGTSGHWPSHNCPGERVGGTSSDPSQEEACAAHWILWLLYDPQPKEMKGNNYFCAEMNHMTDSFSS